MTTAPVPTTIPTPWLDPTPFPTVRPLPVPRTLVVTVNLHGSTVDLKEARPDELYGRNSYGRYATRLGVWRLLDLFRARKLRATWFVPGAEAEAHPEIVEAIAADGHEIAAHGWAMENHAALTEEEERRLLERAHTVLTRRLGRAPAGWRAPEGFMSRATLPHLAALGYAYDASFQDDDHPYALDADGGAGMVELPQWEMLIDAVLYRLRQPHARVLRTWIEEFDALHAENCFAMLTLHPRGDYGSGRAARVAVVERFLDHVATSGDVTLATCAEVAAAIRAGT